MSDIRVFARVYNAADASETAFRTAESDYIGLGEVEVSFFRAFVPGTGWVVVAVGPDASEGMLEGGTPVQLDPDLATLLVRRHIALRPPGGQPAVVRNRYRPGLVIAVSKPDRHWPMGRIATDRRPALRGGAACQRSWK